MRGILRYCPSCDSGGGEGGHTEFTESNAALIHQPLNVRQDGKRRCARAVALDRNPVPVDEKLGEVPLDHGAQPVREPRAQPREGGMCARTIHFDPIEELELRAVAVGKGAYLRARPRLLPPELVARKGEDAQAPLEQRLMQLHELAVVAGRQPSFGGHVDD